MSPTDDLWPKIEASAAELPVAILREQAALLGPKTQGLVEARVDTRTIGENIQHRFLLVAPALDHYTYHLFTVVHGVPDVYPAKVLDLDQSTTLPLNRLDVPGIRLGGPDRRPYAAQNATELGAAMQAILGSERTKEIIGSLLAQSRVLAS